MASIIIGVMGKKRSGKDTFAARLVYEHGYTRLAFADALKESLLELDPILQEDEFFTIRLSDLVTSEGWEKAKEWGEVRELLQRHGVAMRNHVHENVWVGAVERKIEEIPGPVVITDVRFPNEAGMIEDVFGGTLVRIVRPDQVVDDTHISETALDGRDADITVFNDVDIHTLHGEADRIARIMGYITI